MVTRGEEDGGKEIGKEDKEVQTSSCKINESWVTNEQCVEYSQ